MKKSITVGIMLAFVILIFGIWIASQTKISNIPLQQSNEDYTATIFSSPRKIQDFSLLNDKGAPFTNINLKNHWTLVFFGFTHCGGICPTTMAELAKVYKQIPAASIKPQVVFITIDPTRDTTERLQTYLHSFNPEFTGVTGNPAKLKQLRAELGILAISKTLSESDRNNPDNIDHTGTILLFDPNGDYYGLFSSPHQADKIAQDLIKISSGYQNVS